MEIFAEQGWLAFHVLALGVAAVATWTDSRTGLIPNWLTFPVMLLAPVLHGATYGLMAGLTVGFIPSVIGIFVCGMLPAFLFYKNIPTESGEPDNVLGGGDVKLFAGLGGLVGPVSGLVIEAHALFFASLFGVVVIALRGQLGRFLRNLWVLVSNPFRPKDKRVVITAENMNMMRLGPAILAGTLTALVQQDWDLLARYYF